MPDTQPRPKITGIAMDWTSCTLAIGYGGPEQSTGTQHMIEIPPELRNDRLWYESNEGLAWGKASLTDCVAKRELIFALPSQALTHRFVEESTVTSLDATSALEGLTDQAFGQAVQLDPAGMVFDGLSDQRWAKGALKSSSARWWLVAVSNRWVATYERLAEDLGYPLARLETILSALLCRHQDQLSVAERQCWVVHHNACTEWMVLHEGRVQSVQYFSTERLSPAEHQAHLLAQLESTRDQWGFELLQWLGSELSLAMSAYAQSLDIDVLPLGSSFQGDLIEGLLLAWRSQ